MGVQKSPFEIARIRSLCAEGLSNHTIARLVRCSAETVKNYRRRFGLPCRPEHAAAARVRAVGDRLRELEESRQEALASMIGPPCPRGRGLRCGHDRPHGECARCEREQRRFIQIEESRGEEDD